MSNCVYNCIYDYVTFPISPTNLISSLAYELLQSKLLHVIDNMDPYKSPTLDIFITGYKISFSCPIAVSYMSLLSFATFSIVLESIQKAMCRTFVEPQE